MGAQPTVKMGFLITRVSLCVLAITVLYLARSHPIISLPLLSQRQRLKQNT